MKKTFLIFILIFITKNISAQNKPLNLDEGFEQVHSKIEPVSPLLFENKGNAKPISIMPWKQKSIFTLSKGQLLAVRAYPVNYAMYYMFFVKTINSDDKEVITIYEVDEKGNRFIIFSKDSDEYDITPGWQTDYINNSIIENDYIYFGSAITVDPDGIVYKYRYKLGTGNDVEEDRFFTEEEGFLSNVYNHAHTAWASAYFGELEIQGENTAKSKTEFVIKDFKDGFMIGNLSWSSKDKILYFSNHSKNLACIWRYDTGNKELSKIIPEHEADLPFGFTYNYEEYIIYVEKNTIKVAVPASWNKKLTMPPIHTPLKTKKGNEELQLERLKTIPINDTEFKQIEELANEKAIKVFKIVKTINPDYTYAFGLKEAHSEFGSFEKLSILLIKDNVILSEIAYKGNFASINDNFSFKRISNFNINTFDAAYKIDADTGNYGFLNFNAIFFRKENQLIKGVAVSSFDNYYYEEYEEGITNYAYNTFILPPNEKTQNQIWVKKTVGEYKYNETEDKTEKLQYYEEINKYQFSNNKFTLLNPKKTIYYYVNALSGLRQHPDPSLKAMSLELLPFKTKVKLLNKTNITTTINDHGKIIKGNWVRIETKDTLGHKHISYVFDGYLSKTYPSEIKDWKWYHDNKQLGELGHYKNGKKTGEWKWFFKNGNLKAIGSYLDGKPTGKRIWYYANNEIYSTGQYKNGKKAGEWKWYNDNKLRIVIRFDNDKVLNYEVIDTNNNTMLKAKGNNTKISFEEPFEYLRANSLILSEENGRYIRFADWDVNLTIGAKLNDKKAGTWKSYFSNGEIYDIGQYKNGKRHGVFKVFYKNGIVSYIVSYKNGKKSGREKAYFENGQIKILKYYKVGISSGEFKLYYDNGQLKTTGNYSLGKPKGQWVFYSEDGNVIQKTTYKGTYKKTINYKNGKITEETSLMDGKLDGKQNIYFTNGQLKATTTYKDGEKEGEKTVYDENGSLIETTMYKEGKLEGPYTIFYKNGTIKEAGFFKNDYSDGEKKWYYENEKISGIGHYIKGERVGKFISYKKNGIIRSATEYDDSPYVLGEWKYYEDGQLKSEELYHRKGIVDWKYYYPNGQLKILEQHKDGFSTNQVGTWIYYRPDGIIAKVIAYLDERDNKIVKFYHKNGTLYRENTMHYSRIENLIFCYDDKGNTLNKGTLKDGNGTVNEYNAKGILMNIATYKDGALLDNSLSIDGMEIFSDKLNEAAWFFFENEADSIKLKQAINWVQQSIAIDKNYYNTDTYAALLYKTKKYEEALKVAKEAITMAENKNIKHAETTDLLKLIQAQLDKK